jgi:uncharacterized protein (DUF736 family)
MNQRANGRSRNVGAAWQKSGASGPFLSLEIDAGALVADAFAAMLRGEDRVSYLAFVNDKDPDGSERQPDHRIVRPLRRAAGTDEVVD